jgi:alkyl hydroperoxide reductase subunit AhpC
MVMSSMKGIASAIITMHKLGRSADEIQAMLDASEYRDAKREVLNMVSTYIDSITQQQVAQAIRQGEDDGRI